MAFNVDEKFQKREIIMGGVTYPVPEMSSRKIKDLQARNREVEKLPDDSDEKTFALAETLAQALNVAEDTFYDTDIRKVVAATEYVFDVEKKKESQK